MIDDLVTQRRRRTLPHADLARRAPHDPAPRQRRSTAHADRPRVSALSATNAGRRSRKRRDAFAAASRRADRTKVGARTLAGAASTPGATVADVLRRPTTSVCRPCRSSSSRRSTPRSASAWRPRSNGRLRRAAETAIAKAAQDGAPCRYRTISTTRVHRCALARSARQARRACAPARSARRPAFPA